MAGVWGGMLTIVEEATVSSTIDSAKAEYPRLEEGWEALHWLLARSATRIGRAPKSGNLNLRLYVQAGDNIANLPSLWVLYRFDTENVEILAVKVVPYVSASDD